MGNLGGGRLVVVDMNTRYLACALCVLALSSPVQARNAVIENVRYGAYLTDRPGADSQNLATLRKGLVVQVLDEGSDERWAKVRVTDPRAQAVLPMQRGWPGNGDGTGWVSRRFLEIMAEPRPETVPSVNGNEDENDPYGELRRETVRPVPRPVLQGPAAEVATATSFPRRAELGREEDNAGFYGAYLQEKASRSARSLAVLRKGLAVTALKEEGGYVLVRFSPADAKELCLPKVQDFSSTSSQAEGWVGRRYLLFLASGNSEGGNSNEPDPFDDLRGGQDGADDGDGGVPGSLPGEGDTLSSGSVDPSDPSLTEEGVSPRFDGPKVYYLMGADGKDGDYFKGLARGYWKSKNVVLKNAKSDAGEHGATIVPVAVTTIEEIVKILTEGLVPRKDLAKKELYELADLEGSKCRIAGLQVVSHAGCDGPVIEHRQLDFRPFVEDRFATKDPQRPTMFNRVIRGAHLRMSGCNTGNCQYFADHSSFSHLLASLWASKKVQCHGKRTTGDVNSDAFSDFVVDGQGMAHRAKPGKKEYFFYVKKDRVYSEVSISPEGEEERQALLDWYRDRGITPSSQRDGKIVVALPGVTRVAHDSEKDPLLLSVVRMLAEDRSTKSEFYRYLLYMHQMAESDEMDRAREALPQLQKLFNDLKLRKIIQQVKEENGGRLDENDFRIWFRIHYRDYVSETDRMSIGYRACVCDDEHLMKALSSNSLFNRFRRRDW